MRSPGHLPPRAQPAFRHGLGEPRGNGRRDDAAARGAQGGDTPEQSRGVASPVPSASTSPIRSLAPQAGASVTRRFAPGLPETARTTAPVAFASIRAPARAADPHRRTSAHTRRCQERRKSEGCHGGKGGKYHPLVVKRRQPARSPASAAAASSAALDRVVALVAAVPPAARRPARRLARQHAEADGHAGRERGEQPAVRSRATSRSAWCRRGSRSQGDHGGVAAAARGLASQRRSSSAPGAGRTSTSPPPALGGLRPRRPAGAARCRSGSGSRRRRRASPAGSGSVPSTRALRGCSVPSPCVSIPARVRRRGLSRRRGLLEPQVLVVQPVAELVALGAQVVEVVLLRRDLDRHLLDVTVQAVALEARRSCAGCS